MLVTDPPRAQAPPTLYLHQKAGIAEAIAAYRRGEHGHYLAHDPGLGKSLSAILVARLLDARRIFIVTTKAGLGVWRNEFERWWPEKIAHPDVRISNYDRIGTDTNLGALDLLILDEAHYAKNAHSRRGRACARLAKAAHHTLLLSGTPAHSPLDWHAQIRMIAPNEWPWTLTPSAYKAFVCNLEGPFGNWVNKRNPYKRDAVAQIERAMSRHMHKATRDELHLPEPIETVVPVELDAKERAAYRDMAKQLLVELPPDAVADAPIILTKILRLQQITSGFLKDTGGVEHAIGTSKIDACMDLIEERREQKVVVAYRFKWERDELLKRLAYADRPTPYIDGSVSDKQRTITVAAFQESKLPVVLLLQYQAGGTAITLTAADAMIFMSMTPSVIEWEQIKARIHRIGTATHVQYLYLLVDNSVDVDLYDGLRQKADVVALTSLLRRRLAA